MQNVFWVKIIISLKIWILTVALISCTFRTILREIERNTDVKLSKIMNSKTENIEQFYVKSNVGEG